MNKLSKPFIDTRMEQLKEYWENILNVDMDRITDFTKHHCSEDLKRFLECDANLNGNGGGEDEGTEGNDYFDSTGGNRSIGGPTPTKRPVKRASAVNTRIRSIRTKSPLQQGDNTEHVYKAPPPITSQVQSQSKSQPQSKPQSQSQVMTTVNTQGSTTKETQSSTASSSSSSSSSKPNAKSSPSGPITGMPSTPAPPGRNALLADIAKRRID